MFTSNLMAHGKQKVSQILMCSVDGSKAQLGSGVFSFDMYLAIKEG